MAIVIHPIGISTNEAAGIGVFTVVTLNIFKQGLEQDFDQTFFDLEEFATLAQYTTKSGFTFPIKGIMDQSYVETQTNAGIAAQNIVPSFCTKMSAFPIKPTFDDIIVIEGSSYLVLSAEPDGGGVINLILERNAGN